MSRRHGRVPYLALAFAVALGSLVPSEHVHRGDDHHPTVTHRHFSAHRHTHNEIGDPDEAVIWLNDASLQATSPFSLAAVQAVINWPFAIVLPSFERGYPLTFDASPPHGPPKLLLAGRAPPLPA
jgi:hypothetical protein